MFHFLENVDINVNNPSKKIDISSWGNITQGL